MSKLSQKYQPKFAFDASKGAFVPTEVKVAISTIAEHSLFAKPKTLMDKPKTAAAFKSKWAKSTKHSTWGKSVRKCCGK